MGYDHRTVGFDEYDSFRFFYEGQEWLEEEIGEPIITDFYRYWLARNRDPENQGNGYLQRLRIAIFRDESSNQLMVAEEWLAVEDRDCDGTDVVKLAVYRLGHRPRLIKQVLPA